MKAGVLLIGLALMLAGCSQQGGPGGTATLKQCGAEDAGHGERFDKAARACLWDAYGNKQAATFTSTVLTIEGDPIVQSIQIDATGRILVTLDTTRDKFGDQKVTTYTCTALEQRNVPRGDLVEVRLWAGNCTGGEVAELLI